MLDRKTRMMLEVANQLTASDIEYLKAGAPVVPTENSSAQAPSPPVAVPEQPTPPGQASSRGEYERTRSRESKVSTACVGSARAKHEWWPVGTQLIGQIGPERFTAEVVENTRVKSGRSVLITSGPATGELCITPSRAALEATEQYRQDHGLGRGGGVTNGWTFWKSVETQ